VQKGSIPLFEKNEIIANSESMWIEVIETLKTLLKFLLKVAKFLINFVKILQINSKPHFPCRREGDSGVVGSRPKFFENNILLFFSKKIGKHLRKHP
jgi:hypothetical protein